MCIGVATGRCAVMGVQYGLACHTLPTPLHLVLAVCPDSSGLSALDPTALGWLHAAPVCVCVRNSAEIYNNYYKAKEYIRGIRMHTCILIVYMYARVFLL